jgi:hypothetical protein
MCNIEKLSVMLRVQAQLPANLRMKTDGFSEGWKFARSVNITQLEKRINARGWQFIKIADEFLRSGVGDSPQHAIASAMNLSLRCVSEYFNAVGVETIRLTRYQWFWLARVTISPYRIQEIAVPPITDAAVLRPIPCRDLTLPSNMVEVFPQYGHATRMRRPSLNKSNIPASRAD